LQAPASGHGSALRLSAAERFDRDAKMVLSKSRVIGVVAAVVAAVTSGVLVVTTTLKEDWVYATLGYSALR